MRMIEAEVTNENEVDIEDERTGLSKLKDQRDSVTDVLL
jgi:hypothetical protein